MKTKFLFFALFTAWTMQSKSQGFIPNSSFENWTSVNNQFQVPDQWQTNAEQGNNAIERDNYAQDGNSALKINAFGYAITGFPVDEHPGIVSVYVRTAYEVEDTVSIGVKIFSEGNEVDGGSWKNTADAPIPGWSYILIPLSQNVSGADSVTISINGGQRPGTFISADKFSFESPTRGHNAANLISNWRVYPNPASNYVDLQFLVPAATNLTMQLYDMQGQLVSTFYDNLYLWSGNYTRRLDVSSIASGTYLLYVYDGQERTSLKLTIQN